MALFPIERTTVTFRGKTFTVREMTQAERIRWASGIDAQSSGRGQALALKAVHQNTEWPRKEGEPGPTEAELAEEPAEFIEALAKAILKLSGLAEEDEPKKVH